KRRSPHVADESCQCVPPRREEANRPGNRSQAHKLELSQHMRAVLMTGVWLWAGLTRRRIRTESQRCFGSISLYRPLLCLSYDAEFLCVNATPNGPSEVSVNP